MSAELIARLESADGPDRELDAAIARSIGWGCVVRDPEAQNKYVCWRKHYRSGEWIMLPHYTASIDAALTLVPEGYSGQISFNSNSAYATVVSPKCCDPLDDEHIFSAGSKTPALALAAAALKARGV